MLEFHKIKLRQIRWWAWAASVLPLTALAGLFFIYEFGTDTWYSIAMVVGATTTFGFAVVWWWWALWTMAQLTGMFGKTLEKFIIVEDEIKEIKKEVKKDL